MLQKNMKKTYKYNQRIKKQSTHRLPCWNTYISSAGHAN